MNIILNVVLTVPKDTDPGYSSTCEKFKGNLPGDFFVGVLIFSHVVEINRSMRFWLMNTIHIAYI